MSWNSTLLNLTRLQQKHSGILAMKARLKMPLYSRYLTKYVKHCIYTLNQA